MSSYLGHLIDVGEAAADLWRDHAEWSQATFGADSVRGPTGPLKHLAREVQEALADPTDREEYADLLLLLMDSSRRAGLSLMELLKEGAKKLDRNKTRTWPQGSADEPVEHVRTVEAHP